METTSFVLGMLSIIAIAFAIVVVWGIVKINKIMFEIKHTHEWIDNTTRERDYKFEQVQRQHNEDFERSYNHITTNFDHLDRKIAEQDRNMSLEFERVYNQIAECRSYTDSRFDKATSLTSTKQLIKG